MAKDKPADGVYNPSDFLSAFKSANPNMESADLYNDMYSAEPSKEGVRGVQEKYTGKKSKNVKAGSADDISQKGSDTKLAKDVGKWQQDTKQFFQNNGATGKQIGNSNAAVAAAKPGDYFIRKDGTPVVLKQADIDWARKKVPNAQPNVVNDADQPAKNEKQEAGPIESKPVLPESKPDIDPVEEFKKQHPEAYNKEPAPAPAPAEASSDESIESLDKQIAELQAKRSALMQKQMAANVNKNMSTMTGGRMAGVPDTSGKTIPQKPNYPKSDLVTKEPGKNVSTVNAGGR